MNTCERCLAAIRGPGYTLMDYCAVCSRNLCDQCMEQGCCGHKPALSGQEADYGGEKGDSIGIPKKKPKS